METLLSKELIAVCERCGIALTALEVTGEIAGGQVDYRRHTWQPVSMVFCLECWDHLTTREVPDMETAIRRRKRVIRDGGI